MKKLQTIQIQKTKDGSSTLYVEALDETYHSSHGALQEAKHVFIENGIKLFSKNKLRVLEVGFGSGLNAVLTCQFASEHQIEVDYVGLETVPLGNEIIEQLNYLSHDDSLSPTSFKSMHSSQWEIPVRITDYFKLEKRNQKIQEFTTIDLFDVVYYDAFGPRAQIEMWDRKIFENLYKCLNLGGKLVTYCAMGQFKRDLKSVGFVVENVPGPPGKREMTIATKI